MIKNFCFCVVLLFTSGSFGKSQNLSAINSMFENYQKSFKSVTTVDPADPALNFKEFVIVDARESYEREVSYIPDSISKAEFDQKRSAYKKNKILVYCTIGYRSGRLANDLKNAGMDAYNLKGGILLWIHSGRGLINKSGVSKSVHVFGKKWNLVPPGWTAIW
ncbi:MAG: rhodanese-like domain-containing protein [Bdellovibrionales bacterium]